MRILIAACVTLILTACGQAATHGYLSCITTPNLPGYTTYTLHLDSPEKVNYFELLAGGPMNQVFSYGGTSETPYPNSPGYSGLTGTQKAQDSHILLPTTKLSVVRAFHETDGTGFPTYHLGGWVTDVDGNFLSWTTGAVNILPAYQATDLAFAQIVVPDGQLVYFYGTLTANGLPPWPFVYPAEPGTLSLLALGFLGLLRRRGGRLFKGVQQRTGQLGVLAAASAMLILTACGQAATHGYFDCFPTPNLPGYSTWTLHLDSPEKVNYFEFSAIGPMNQVFAYGGTSETPYPNSPGYSGLTGTQKAQDSHILLPTTKLSVVRYFHETDASGYITDHLAGWVTDTDGSFLSWTTGAAGIPPANQTENLSLVQFVVPDGQTVFMNLYLSMNEPGSPLYHVETGIWMGSEFWVPEPASLCLFTFAAAALLRRRRWTVAK